MSNFGDEFKIGSYMKPINETERKYPSFHTDTDKAKEWSELSMKSIVYPTDTEKELDSLWKDYQSMPRKYRKQADDKSTELFGCDNSTHYEKLKSVFLKDDIKGYKDYDDIDSSVVSEAAAENTGAEYTAIDVEKALEWSKQTGYPIIYPTRTLEELEELWNSMASYRMISRKESDQRSRELFGMNNEEHYKYLRSQFLKDDIEKPLIESFLIGEPLLNHQAYGMNESVDAATRARDLLSLVMRKNETYENCIIKDMVDKVTGEYIASHQNVNYDVIPFEDLPFFTPDEMIDFGVNQANPEDNFYGCEPVANVISEDGDWFTDYTNACNGFNANYDPIKWKDNVAKLMLKMKTAENKDPYKQAILNLGWPPEAEFSPENRVKATKRLKMKLAMNNGTTEFVDLTGMTAEDIDEAVDPIIPILKPVFIVLEEGGSLMSAAIKKVTNSTYSHAAISFDPTMETMYSYGIENSPNGIRGGFIKEHIKDKNPNRHMAVFAIFLKPEDWQRLKDTVDDFIKNISKTSYSYINLLVSHIFRIPFDMDRKMVCSQFVDRVLKLTDIDISNKDSSLVAPADYQKFAKENKKIYVLFDDIVKKFKPTRIKGLVKTLSRKADPIKEANYDTLGAPYEMINHIRSLKAMQEICSSIDINTLDPSVKKIYEAMIKPCLYAECYLAEAKNFPVQFDKYGSMYINGVKKKDFELEYRKSHKILRQYEKVGNIDGIKYELFKLQAMVDAIDIKLKKKDDKELRDTRARIINDLDHFMEIAMKLDPKFNFSKEYERSEFYDKNIRINNHTLKVSGKILKAIAKSL